MSVRSTVVLLALVASFASVTLACEEDSSGGPGVGTSGGLGDGGGGGIDGSLGPATTPPIDAAGDFCQKTLGVVGGALDTCCTAADKTTQDYDFTRRIVATLLPVCTSTLEASIAKKRVLYRTAEGDACYAAYQTTYSPDKCSNITQTFFDPAGTSCREAFVGVGDVGALCMGDHECVAGLTCVGYTKSSDGSCKGPPAVGEDCGPAASDGGSGGSTSLEFGSHPSCASGARCDSLQRKCVTAAGDGEPCSSTDLCAASLHCVMGKCGPSGPGGEGAKCLRKDDCTPDSYCLGASGETPGSCTKKKAAGGSCTGSSFVTECIGRCDAPSGQAGTCASFCGSP